MKKRNEFKHTISFIEDELSSGTFPGAALAVMLGDRQLVERRYWGSYSSRTRREIPGCSPNCHPCGHATSEITREIRITRIRDFNFIRASEALG